MPIPTIRLDDRNYDDLVRELLERIPGHTPEWTNHGPADPGRTMIELFAWLADTLLYRVNLIPERQRLAFLRLLNIPMLPARAARGLLSLALAGDRIVRAARPPVFTRVKGPVDFETCGGINVLPLSGQLYIKRRPTADELAGLDKVISGLETIYGLDCSTSYITTRVFAQAEPQGLDVIHNSIDGCLWIGLFAAAPELVARVREELTRDENGARILNIGISPVLQVDPLFSSTGNAERVKTCQQWEIVSTRGVNSDEPLYLPLEIVSDTTDGLRRQGVIRLELPDSEDMGLPENDVAKDTRAGVGDRPPRLDDEKAAARLITWLRLRSFNGARSLSLTWAGINVVEIDQFRTLKNIVVATSSGEADQVVQLPGRSVDDATLRLQVEESGRGYVDWRLTSGLVTAGRDDRFFELDREAGTVTFGDGVRGRIPEKGRRIRVAMMRYGGGKKGNLNRGVIKAISYPNLKAEQPLPLSGGADAEELEQAEKRIPAFLQHNQRAVTAADYRQLALETPGVALGRVEVLPRFKPHQYRDDVPGVVSVMIFPKIMNQQPPNPRPDRLLLEQVHEWLDARRPLAMELYVIGPEYIDIGVSVAVDIRSGHGRDKVLKDIRQRLRTWLWALEPGGNTGQGWRLGRPVIDQELEVEA